MGDRIASILPLVTPLARVARCRGASLAATVAFAPGFHVHRCARSRRGPRALRGAARVYAVTCMHGLMRGPSQICRLLSLGVLNHLPVERLQIRQTLDHLHAIQLRLYATPGSHARQ